MDETRFHTARIGRGDLLGSTSTACSGLSADIAERPRGFTSDSPGRFSQGSAHSPTRLSGNSLGATDAGALHLLSRSADHDPAHARLHDVVQTDSDSSGERTSRLPRGLTPGVIDEPYLRSFGEMLVPWGIWQAVQRFAVWIEPALVEEWIRLMQRYAETQGRDLPRDRVAATMTWSDPTRDVRIAKQQARELIESGKLYCVWSGKRLSARSLDLDHCFPWSAWPCSDLWNLCPPTAR